MKGRAVFNRTLGKSLEQAKQPGIANLDYFVAASSCEVISMNQDLPPQTQKYQSRP